MKKTFFVVILIMFLGSCTSDDVIADGDGTAFVSEGRVVQATTKFDMSQFFTLVAGKEWVVGHEFYFDKKKVGRDLSEQKPGYDANYFKSHYKFQINNTLHRYRDERLCFNVERPKGAPAFSNLYYQELDCDVNIAARTIKMSFPELVIGGAKNIVCWRIVAVDSDRIIMDQTTSFPSNPIDGYDSVTFGHRVILITNKFSQEMRDAKECKPHWANCLDYMKNYNPELWERYKDDDGSFLYYYM